MERKLKDLEKKMEWKEREERKRNIIIKGIEGKEGSGGGDYGENWGKN